MKNVLTLLFILLGSSLQAQEYGWDGNIYLPGLGRDDAVCFTMDNIIFFGSGNHGGFNESNIFYALNTRNGEWQDVAPFPGSARQYSLTEVVEFKAYLIGGIDEFGNPLNDIWEYDLINDQWNELTSFPGPARWKAASFMVNGRIYYGTGRDWNNSFNDFWEYNTYTDQWKQLSDMPVVPRNETVGFALYGRGYIGLGMDCTNVMQKDFWAYDPFSAKWTFETDFPAGPRWYAVAEVLDGNVFVGTGEDSTGQIKNDWWKYHPGTKIWEQEENIPLPARRGSASCSLPYSAILLFGGLSDNFDRLTDISRYTSRDNEPPPLNAHYNFEEKRVYINDIPHHVFIRVLNLSGQLLFETSERIDHVGVDVSNWEPGVYLVWVGDRAVKFLIH